MSHPTLLTKHTSRYACVDILKLVGMIEWIVQFRDYSFDRTCYSTSRHELDPVATNWIDIYIL